MSIATAAGAVRERIAAAGGDPEGVRLVAVTKGHSLATVQAATAAGLMDLGESYAQELVAKAEAVQVGVRWHFIGRLQSNKVRRIAPFVYLWHSVDRLSLAAEIARHAPSAAVLVQVNVTGLPQQAGCSPEQVAALVEGCMELGLEVRGLMAIGPRGPDTLVRASFASVRALADRLGLPERSMGMSGDLAAAVAEGSTMVRIGTDLFGPRDGASVVGQ